MLKPLAALLLLFAPFPTAALAQKEAPAAVREVPIGTYVDWSDERDGSPARYRAGEVELTFEGRRDPESPDLVQALLTVALPGVAPVTVEGAMTPASFDHRAAVGRAPDRSLFVLFQSFSGGAHCCTEFTFLRPAGGRFEVTSLGEWDGGPLDALPTDFDGDGTIDFVFVDNAFLYAFASYAESSAPPKIFNVVDGARVDVSDRPGFRRLFEEAMQRDRQACLHPDGMSPNGACAAYVASAARVGRFDSAWAEMLRAYDRNFEWELPMGCRSLAVDKPCPEGDILRFDNYPDALRAFLVDLGYIPR
ncbi:MAG: hypothetical protein ACXWU1_05035 [Allosphingosinicella sp.]